MRVLFELVATVVSSATGAVRWCNRWSSCLRASSQANCILSLAAAECREAPAGCLHSTNAPLILLERFGTFVAAAMMVVCVSSCQLARAATVEFAVDVTGKTGTVRGKVPLEKLAGVDIPRGRVSFKEGIATVTTIPEWQFDRQEVLSGPVLKVEGAVVAGKADIHGLVYFLNGDWLHYLSPASPRETIVTGSGELSGHVAGIAGNTVEFVENNGQRSQIAVSSITTIYSPRAFTFNMLAPAPAVVSAQQFQSEVYNIRMRPTSRVFQMTALKSELCRAGDGDLSGRQLMAIGVTISAIQLGQMLPALIYPLTSPHLSRQANRLIYDTVASPINVSPRVSVPAQLVPPPQFR